MCHQYWTTVQKNGSVKYSKFYRIFFVLVSKKKGSIAFGASNCFGLRPTSGEVCQVCGSFYPGEINTIKLQVYSPCLSHVSLHVNTLTLTLNPISYPSGTGDCTKTHVYINLKLLDFSYISKTKILKKKKIRFFYPTPPRRGVLKKMKIFKVGQRA